jgi:oligopeptide/dipeptide ABC transporter ATP-binding protein
MESLLEVENLQVAFNTDAGELTCVEDVSFNIKKGEVLCIVGESGCGKSVSALSLMGLLGKNGRIKQGSAFFAGENIAAMSPEQIRKLRGNRLAMIFQEPMTSLNPVLTVGRQMLEPLEIHQGKSREEGIKICIDWLEKVGIPRPEKVFADYPGTLSGGMRQRVMIAMAMLCNPSLLIADEPTTALDVTIQAQILDLMENLREETGSSILLITHDLGVVAEMADRVAVMYAGQIVEEADVFTLFANPLHPYTKGLIASIPNVSDDFSERLESIPGSVPSLKDMPRGCRFYERCSRAMEKCRKNTPPLFPLENSHGVRCWLSEGGKS